MKPRLGDSEEGGRLTLGEARPTMGAFALFSGGGGANPIKRERVFKGVKTTRRDVRDPRQPGTVPR